MYNQYHRKYPKVTGWWIYVHRTPNGLYYVGRSQKQISKRWKIGNGYNGTTLEPYIEQYGWDNIEHLVIKDGLTKEEALQWEGRLIKMYTSIGCCINHFNSGGEWSKDPIKYKSKWQTKCYIYLFIVLFKHFVHRLFNLTSHFKYFQYVLQYV